VGAALIDRFIADPDFRERHAIDVAGTAADAYRAIWATDFGGSRIVAALLALRSLPSAVLGRAPVRRAAEAFTLRSAIGERFGLLAEAPGEEVVVGVAGRFWRPTGNVEPFRRELFDGPLPRGLAKAVWNFAVESAPGRSVRVTTETRVACADRASRLKFAAYWALIRPFSGLIRIRMLRAIRRTCLLAAARRG
jgi:hypothetical protein